MEEFQQKYVSRKVCGSVRLNMLGMIVSLRITQFDKNTNIVITKEYIDKIPFQIGNR